jgi:hypothetical protein
MCAPGTLICATGRFTCGSGTFMWEFALFEGRRDAARPAGGDAGAPIGRACRTAMAHCRSRRAAWGAARWRGVKRHGLAHWASVKRHPRSVILSREDGEGSRVTYFEILRFAQRL